jgi:GNAT superfamily N-acetyltransferase
MRNRSGACPGDPPISLVVAAVGSVVVSLTIEPARDRDAGELWTLQRAAFVEEARELSNPFIPPLNETLAELRAAFSEVTFLKVVDGSRIVAAGRLRVRDDAGWIERIAVAPDQQGRGIGSALLPALEAEAPDAVEHFELYTAALRSLNLAFYERHGYVEAERIQDPSGVAVVHFTKRR